MTQITKERVKEIFLGVVKVLEEKDATLQEGMAMAMSLVDLMAQDNPEDRRIIVESVKTLLFRIEGNNDNERTIN